MKSSAAHNAKSQSVTSTPSPDAEARDLEFDDSEDVEFWESRTESDSGRRISDSSQVKGTVEARGRKQLDDDLALESQAQMGGDRAVQKVQSQGKSSVGSKNRTSQSSPKRANPETRSSQGAAERRSGEEDAQGITAHRTGEEDDRQKKVVAIRNDAKAAGRRTGSSRKAS